MSSSAYYNITKNVDRSSGGTWRYKSVHSFDGSQMMIMIEHSYYFDILWNFWCFSANRDTKEGNPNLYTVVCYCVMKMPKVITVGIRNWIKIEKKSNCILNFEGSLKLVLVKD